MVLVGVFYASNEFSGLYFRTSRCTLQPQRGVQPVAQIKGVNEINCLKSAVVLMDIFMRLMNLVGYIFVHQDARYALKRDSIFNV